MQAPIQRQSFGPTLMQATVPPHQSQPGSSNGQFGHMLPPISRSAAFAFQQQQQMSGHLPPPLYLQQITLSQAHEQQEHLQRQASLSQYYQQPGAGLSALLPSQEVEALLFTADLMPATWQQAAWGSNAGGPTAAAAVPAAPGDKARGGWAQGVMTGYGGEEAPSGSGGSQRRGKKEPVVAKLPPWAGAGWDPHMAVGTRSGGTGVFLPKAPHTLSSANSIPGAAAASGVVGSGDKLISADVVAGSDVVVSAAEPAAVRSSSAPLPEMAVAQVLAVAQVAAAGGGSIPSSGANSISDEHISPFVERGASPSSESAANDTLCAST